MGALVGLAFGIGCLLVWSAFRSPRPAVAASKESGTRRLLAEAGLRDVAPRSLAALCAGGALLATVLVLGLTRTVPIALVLGALAGYLPLAVVRGRARRSADRRHDL